MLLYGLSAPQLSGAGLGFTEYDACADNVGNVPNGEACTLPDGSNIAVWNGAQLTLPDGSAIDPTNLAALLNAGWSAALLKGAPGAGGSPAGQQAQGGGTPWWASALQAVTGGVAAGLKPSGAPAVAAKPPAPWYSTPIGMGGIAIGVLALVFYLAKK